MSRLVSIFRLVILPLLAAATLGLVAPAASAAPATKLDANLAALWTTVLQTPSAQNPFGSGGPASECINLGGTVAPFGPSGVPSCTVKPGTKIFVAASSFECSTFEGNGTTEAELQACAKQSDVQTAPSVTVDGRSVPVTEAETGLLQIVLPADNIFSLPAGETGLSFGHGWVSLLHPLAPGTHIIVGPSFTTTIIVTPGSSKLTGSDLPMGRCLPCRGPRVCSFPGWEMRKPGQRVTGLHSAARLPPWVLFCPWGEWDVPHWEAVSRG